MFEGIPQEAYQFYADLEQDRGWWAEHGHIYREVVRPAMEGLVDELDWRWQPLSIYRPYRNVRFSPNKDPYKSACGASGAEENGAMHYVQIGAAWVLGDDEAPGLRISRGMYWFSPDQLLRYYDAVHEDDDNELKRAMDSVSGLGHSVGGGQKLVRAPRGFSVEHRRIDLLRLGGITVSRAWRFDDPAIQGPGVADLVQRAWEDAEPVAAWLAKHVGPPEL